MADPSAPPPFDRLFAHDASVRALAASLIADPSAADDVVQESLLAAWRKPPREPAKERGYLARIVRRFAFNRGRSERRRRTHERNAARPEAVAAERVLEREEARRRLLDAVAALEAPLRAVVLLRWFEERTPTEIAAELGAPVETVKTRLKRAHQCLRESLESEFGGRDSLIAALLPLLGPSGPGAIAATVEGGESAGRGPAVGSAATTKLKGLVVAASFFVACAGVVLVCRERFVDGDAARPLETLRGDATTAASGDPSTAAPSPAVARSSFADVERGEMRFVLRDAERGTPLADAEIVLLRRGGAMQRAVTDASGGALLACADGEGALLLARMPKRAPLSTFVVGKAPVADVAVHGGRRLYGRVTVDGAAPGRPVRIKVDGQSGLDPVAESMFRALRRAESRPNEWSASPFVVVADATGAFEAAGLGPARDGDYWISSDEPGLEIAAGVQARGAYPFAMPVVQDASGEIRVPLVSRATLSGRVRSYDGGSPPASARAWVDFVLPAENGNNDGDHRSAALDAEGAFVESVPNGRREIGGGTAVLFVVPSPGAPAFEFVRQTEAAADVHTGDLLLPRLRTLAFVVHDADGRPIRGASIRVADEALIPPDESDAQTDAAGRAEVLVDDRPHTFRAAAPGFGAAAVATNVETQGPIDVVLGRGGRLVVSVLDAVGAPIREACIVARYPWPLPSPSARSSAFGIVRGSGDVRPPDPHVGGSETTAVLQTDENGVLELAELPPGSEVRLTVGDAAGDAAVERSVHVQEDAATAVEIRLAGRARSIAVRVVDAEDRPVFGYVFLKPRPPWQPPFAERDVDGVYRLSGLVGAEAHVRVTSGLMLPREVDVPLGDDDVPTTVRLGRGLRREVRCRDEAGDPVRADEIRCGSGAAASGAEVGRYVFDGTGPGPLAVRVLYAGEIFERTLADTEAVQEFVLPSTGGCVVSFDRTPPADELWLATLTPGDVSRRTHRDVLHRGPGGGAEASFGRLPIGRYELRVGRVEGAASRPQGGAVRTVEIRRNEITRLAMNL